MFSNWLIHQADPRVWRTATWAVPFTVQLVVGLIVSLSWLVGRSSLNVHGLPQFLMGAAITVVLSIALSAGLFARRSWWASGIAISVVGSLIVTIIGATGYGFWIIGW